MNRTFSLLCPLLDLSFNPLSSFELCPDWREPFWFGPDTRAPETVKMLITNGIRLILSLFRVSRLSADSRHLSAKLSETLSVLRGDYRHMSLTTGQFCHVISGLCVPMQRF